MFFLSDDLLKSVVFNKCPFMLETFEILKVGKPRLITLCRVG